MRERVQPLDKIGAFMAQLTARGLPEQTSSLLESNITLQQFRVLLQRGSTPISGVAEALGIRPNVATGMIQRLVERELIERHEDPIDRRVRLPTVTEHGLTLIDELNEVVSAKRRELLHRHSDEQLHQPREILTHLTR